MAGLGAAALAGCSTPPELPNVVYLGVGINADQTIDSNLLQDTDARLRVLESGYRQIHPSTRFQFSLYPEHQLERAIQRRSRAGLAPDLLLVNADTAVRLLRDGLTSPFPISRIERALFHPEQLQRLQGPGDALAGLPVLVQTQLACFNRRRMPTPPVSLTELLAMSASGHPVGLSVELSNLFWTVGSLGAFEGISAALAGRQPSRLEQQGVERWLTWLQDASNQQRVTFFATQTSAEGEFQAGRLDWLPCRSSSLPRLRQSLGASLGVAALPSGVGGDPTPISRLRVLALGKTSSRSSRDRAITFGRFSVNPLSQRNLTLGSQVVLPANRFVKVPVSSSLVLEAMVTSAQQSNRTTLLGDLLHSRDPRLASTQGLITELVFGEVSPASASQSLIAALRETP